MVMRSGRLMSGTVAPQVWNSTAPFCTALTTASSEAA